MKISISKGKLKFLIVLLVAILIFHYGMFIIKTPIEEYSIKKLENLKENYIELEKLLEPVEAGSFHFFFFGIPQKSRTEQELTLDVLRTSDNLFLLNSKTFVNTEANITYTGTRFIGKSTVQGLPDIFLNNEKIEIIESEQYYEFGKARSFSSLISPNIYEIKNLKIYRKKYEIPEIKVPWFFSEENFLFSINIPQIFPVIVSKDSESDFLVYEIETPKFRKINKEISGWQRVFVPKNPISDDIISQSIRNGLIKQSFYNNEPRKNWVTFKTKISKDNPYSTFEVTFMPSNNFFVFIVFILVIPIFSEYILKLKKNLSNRSYLFLVYSLITLSLSGFSVLDFEEPLLFLITFIELTSFPFLLLLLIVYPLIYLLVLKTNTKNK